MEVEAGGRIALAGTPYLAGAGHLLDRGLGELLKTGCGMAAAVEALTTTPARLLGLKCEPLGPGTVSDCTLFRKSLSGEVDVEAVISGGRLYGNSGGFSDLPSG